MRRLVILTLIGIASCKTPPPPEPSGGVRINAPGVNVSVQKDAGVKVYDPSGRSGVPTIDVPRPQSP